MEITDEIIFVSQLFGAHARASPTKSTPMLRAYLVPERRTRHGRLNSELDSSYRASNYTKMYVGAIGISDIFHGFYPAASAAQVYALPDPATHGYRLVMNLSLASFLTNSSENSVTRENIPRL